MVVVQTLHDLILSPDVTKDAKLRVTILYALRYQKMAGNAISQSVKMLEQNGVDPEDAAVRFLSFVLLCYNQPS